MGDDIYMPSHAELFVVEIANESEIEKAVPVIHAQKRRFKHAGLKSHGLPGGGVKIVLGIPEEHYPVMYDLLKMTRYEMYAFKKQLTPDDIEKAKILLEQIKKAVYPLPPDE